MDSEYPFSIFWSLCCLIYRFWLLLWYLLVIVLSDIQILISPLVSFGHCVVWYTDSDCPFGTFWSLCCLIYRFWLPLWYLLVIVLSDIQILIAPLVSFGHCVVWYTDSDCPFGIFWSLCCLIYRLWLSLWYLLVIVLSDIQILISPLVSFGHCVVWYTDSDFPFGIFWPLWCLLYRFWLPFAFSWSLCCLIYKFWFPLWYLLAIVLFVIQILITLWFLLVIEFFDIQILIAPLVSFGHCVVWYTDSEYTFSMFRSLCFLIYRFWLLLWYLLVIVLSDIWILNTPLVSFGHCVVWYTDSDFPSGIFWSLCCLIYRFWFPLWYLLAIVLSVIQILITLWFLLVIVLSDIQILISPLVSFGHCVVCYTDSDYPLVSFGHCVVWYTDSDCPFGIFWSLCCLIYRFWIHL